MRFYSAFSTGVRQSCGRHLCFIHFIFKINYGSAYESSLEALDTSEEQSVVSGDLRQGEQLQFRNVLSACCGESVDLCAVAFPK